MLTNSYAQELSATVEQKLENLTEHTDGDVEDDSYLQQLDYYKKHPLNINAANKEDLVAFKFLTGLQIEHLLAHRQVQGFFIDIYELQGVAAWDVGTIKKLLPFITVQATVPAIKPLLLRFKGGEHTLLLRESKVLEKAKGYNPLLPNPYTGSNDHVLVKYKYVFNNNLQYGITAEKDAGEPLLKKGYKKGFDFYSAHFFAKNLGVIKALAVGDYTVNMGQGLIQWQTLAFKKSADGLAIKRQAPVLTPYSSAGEFYFNRGAGITLKTGNLETTAFISRKTVNANIAEDTAITNSFTGFLTSGLHRTEKELKDKNSLQQTSAGGVISYQLQQFKVSFNAVHYQFSKALQKEAVPYHMFSASGKQWFNGSVDYSYTYKNLHLFGEAALDKHFKKAFIQGALLSIAANADVSVLYRNIDKAYGSLYSNAFTENTAPVNENGVYVGLALKPAFAWRIDAYADHYKFLWIKYRVNAPATGRDYVMQLTHTPTKHLEIYFRYKNEVKPLNSSGAVLNYPTPVTKESWRTHFYYTINKQFSFRSRVEVMRYYQQEKEKEQGFLAFAELLFKNPLLAANARLQYFDTDGYNSRLYAYESDVLYSYSVPPSFDEGFRYYINVNFGIAKNITCWLRFAQTIYFNKAQISAGLEEISGNKKSDIKFQIRYSF